MFASDFAMKEISIIFRKKIFIMKERSKNKRKIKGLSSKFNLKKKLLKLLENLKGSSGFSSIKSKLKILEDLIENKYIREKTICKIG